jgi:hypothetical protein
VVISFVRVVPLSTLNACRHHRIKENAEADASACVYLVPANLTGRPD